MSDGDVAAHAGPGGAGMASWPGGDGPAADFLRVTLPGRPESVPQARRLAAPLLAAWAAEGDEADTALLLISELVTNAVRFSPGALVLALWRLPGRLVVEVSDQSPDLPLQRQSSPDAENGRGMLLVAGLAAEWGCFVPGPDRKTVWCSIAMPRECAATQPRPGPRAAARPALAANG